MLAGGSIQFTINGFLDDLKTINDKNSLYTYLTHLGLLAYDDHFKMSRIPNLEVLNICKDIMA